MPKIYLLIFCIVVADAQLNFNGNSLTDNTDYTAEESQNYERTNGQRASESNGLNKNSPDSLTAESRSLLDNQIREKLLKTSIDVKPINVQLKDVSYNNENKNNNNVKLMPSATVHQASPANPSIKVLDSTSHMQMQSREEYSTNQRDSSEKIRASPRQIASSVSNEALNSFLNSQTPEESQYALEKYLQTQEQVNQSPVQYDPSLNVENYNTANVKTLQFLPNQRVNTNQAIPDQIDDLPNFQSIPELPETQKLYQAQSLRSIQSPWYQGIKNKPYYYRPGMRNSYIYNQGRPANKKYLQSRLMSDYGPQESLHVGYNSYNKRANRRYGPYSANSPVVYSAHPPPITSPPVDGNLLYSQLYAQSYDPYYYNYIAKTGKIKPWLYGKLGSREEPSMWNELYRSFKKHGMKNIMNPMFLLGLSIPALTLMLSAIISKRSFGRSADGNGYISEETLNELEEKVRAAIEYYENNVNGDKKDCK
ncbi:uncharacterized protein [Chelonus insularis]|uniref:uncharacterized protein n=1 Tax=Chelonus insularis TaxID=460826 RepID=UPI00158BCB98|nr:uncharacterized protein LOC118064723 [Chelonus insularis]XP_034935425.1 uncharacterized protein LOC118064723 [Chelonus insularis]